MKGDNFKATMTEFVHNAVEKNELVKLPVDVYWSIAFAPLYNLIKFHLAGKSIRGTDFALTDDMLTQTLDIVIKALKP